MNDFPRQMLRQIVAKYGKEICSDARRCENLLKDLCGSYNREINVLVTAVEEHVPLDLLATNGSMPLELLLTRLEKRLAEQTALTSDAARWAVESWALALNLTTENEIEARQKQIESIASQVTKTKTIPPNQSSPSEMPDKNRNDSTRKPTITPSAPHQRTVPPVIQQPAPMPKSSPPAISPKNNPPVAPPFQKPTVNQPTPVRKGFGIFRGCLIIVFLLAITSVALLFGVPYAIEVMRETQRERNDESPRFPSR
jgi:DNA polymerase III gamma/tau subunit